jgi:hypothetical protein
MRSLLAVMAFAVLAHLLWSSEKTHRTPATVVINEVPRARSIVLAERVGGKDIPPLETKYAAVVRALEKNSPHGRSWEELPQDEFSAEVNAWGEDILLAAELSIDHPSAKQIGYMLYRHHDPYLKYLGYFLISRTIFKTRTEMEDAVMMLGRDPLLEDYFSDSETEETVSHERMVRHKLINGLLDESADRIVQQLKIDQESELWHKSYDRMKTYAATLPSKKAELVLDMTIDRI